MKKNKKILYIMLPIVILVWGYVFVQFFSFFSTSPQYAKETPSNTISIDNINVDTFSIVANYRDPFLGKSVPVKHNSNLSKKRKKKKRKSTESKKKQNNMPSIEYKGMIKNNNSEKRVGIIIINGAEKIVKEDQSINDLKIIEINKELITVRFQNEKKTIKK